MTESFAELFEQSLASQRIRPGQILSGLVVDVGDDMVIVNVGLESEAVIPVEQFKNERGEIEVKAGDMVSVREKSKKQGRVLEALQLATQVGLPAWVEVNVDKAEGVFKKTPDRDEFAADINESLIVELYSR